MQNVQNNELFELRTSVGNVKAIAAVEQEDISESSGEYCNFLRTMYEKDFDSYISPKSSSCPSSLDPAGGILYTNTSLVDLLLRLRSCLYDGLTNRVSPPLEIAFKLSAIINSYTFPLRLASCRKSLKQRKIFLNEVFGVISTILSETISTKMKFQSQGCKELYHQVVISAIIIQITLQLEYLRYLHMLNDCKAKLKTTSKNPPSEVSRKSFETAGQHIDRALTKVTLLFETSSRIEEKWSFCRFDLNQIVSSFVDGNDPSDDLISKKTKVESSASVVSVNVSHDTSNLYDTRTFLGMITKVYEGLKCLKGSRVIESCFPVTSFDPCSFLGLAMATYFDDDSEEIDAPNGLTRSPKAGNMVAQSFSFYSDTSMAFIGENLFENMAPRALNSSRSSSSSDPENKGGESRLLTGDVLAKVSIRNSVDPPSVVSKPNEVSNSLLRKPSTYLGHRAALAGRLQRKKSVTLSFVPPEKLYNVSKPTDCKLLPTDKARPSSKLLPAAGGRGLKRSYSESSGLLVSDNHNEDLIHRGGGIDSSRLGSQKMTSKSSSGNSGTNLLLPARRNSVQETPMGKVVPQRPQSQRRQVTGR